jgi:hypothetical protein
MAPPAPTRKILFMVFYGFMINERTKDKIMINPNAARII